MDEAADDRRFPPMAGGERDTVEGFLDLLRGAIVLKARGLSDADGARRLVSSLTTVSGLVRHLAHVERFWFREDLDGERGIPTLWSEEDPDGDFRVTDQDSLEAIIDDYLLACEESRAVAARFSLDQLCVRGNDHSLRWILLHMIEETGRHAGHIDILREQLDGVVGE